MIVAIQNGWIQLEEIVMLNSFQSFVKLRSGGTVHVSEKELDTITKLKTQEQGGLVYEDSIRISWTIDEMQAVIKDWFQGTLATYFDDQYGFARDLIVSSVKCYAWGEDGIMNCYVYIEDQDGRTRRIDLKIRGAWHELEMYDYLMLHLQKLVFEDWLKAGFDDDDE
jgi:hypothetical protein